MEPEAAAQEDLAVDMANWAASKIADAVAKQLKFNPQAYDVSTVEMRDDVLAMELRAAWGLPTDLFNYRKEHASSSVACLGSHTRGVDPDGLMDGNDKGMVSASCVGDGTGSRVGDTDGDGDLWGGIGVVFEERPLARPASKSAVKGKRTWGLVVDALVESGPAARCGQIEAGDVLEFVDGLALHPPQSRVHKTTF